MNENFKEDIGVTPSLSFDVVEENNIQVQNVDEENSIVDESALTEEERKMVNDFVEKIDLTNTNSVLKYGVGAQKKIADFSETALNNVKTKDLGEIGEMLSNVVTQLKDFEETEDKKGGILGIFKKPVKKIEQMKVMYNKV